MNNLALNSSYSEILERLKMDMATRLEEQADPRILGNGDIFDSYQFANEHDRNFYERYMSGEKIEAGWVNESDFEDGPLE